MPKHHFGAESMHRAWLNTEGLPEKRTEDYQPLVDKWVEATGKFPGMSEVQVHSLDGVRRRRARLARDWAGPPVILLHGLFSDANMNWIKFGHADADRGGGFPRDHARPSRPRAQRQAARAGALSERHPGAGPARAGRPPRPDRVRPRRLLARRRTTVEAVGEGLQAAPRDPRRRGLEGLRNWERRKNFFLEAIELFDRVQRGDPHWLSIQFMKSQKIDRVAAALLLESFEDAFLDWLKAFTMPTLVVCGSEDDDNGSAEELADALPNAIFQRGAGHAHELGHQARFGRGDRGVPRQ